MHILPNFHISTPIILVFFGGVGFLLNISNIDILSPNSSGQENRLFKSNFR